MNESFINYKCKRNKLCINLNDILATLAFSINYFIAIIGGSIQGMSVLYILFFIQLYRTKIKMNIISLVAVFILLILFCFSEFKLGYLSTTNDYLINFICFDIVLFFIGGIKFNKNKIIQYSVILGFIGLPVFIYKVSILYDNMGVGYAILPLFLTSIICLITLFSKIIKICAVCNIITFGLFYIQEGMRGILLAIITFLILFLYTVLISKIEKKYRYICGIILINAGMVLITIILQNLVFIVLNLNLILEKHFHLEIYAIRKFLYYVSQGNISNGRSFLIEKAIQMIKKSPIIGNGIGYFESNIFTYVHNIFLQVTCEFGVLGFLIMTYIFIYTLKKIFFTIPYKYKLNEHQKKESLFFIVIFITGVFFLLYSSSYWLYGQFWFFLGVLLKERFYEKKKGRK